MKRNLAVLLMVCLVILTGCGGNDSAGHTAGDVPLGEAVTYADPLYQIESVIEREQFTAEDGTLLLSSSYQLLELTVANSDTLSPEDLEGVQQNIASFNTQMTQQMNTAKDMVLDIVADAQMAYEQGYSGGEYSDETMASGVILGEIVSVRLENYSYYGGAHPNRGTFGMIFDLASGQFIDPTQLADDPETFRTGAAELLVEKADSMGEEYTSGYWADYRDIIARWNEGAVLFDDTGMTVHYSPYDLGPYAMGDVELVVSYSELEPLIGPGGMAKLGLSMKAAE